MKGASKSIVVRAGVQPGRLFEYQLPEGSNLLDLIELAGGLENGDWGDLSPKEFGDGSKEVYDATVGTDVVEPQDYGNVELEDGDLVGFKKRVKGNQEALFFAKM